MGDSRTSRMDLGTCGKQSGTWTQFWNNGKIKHRSHWLGHVCDGAAESFDQNGILVRSEEFQEGELARNTPPKS